MGEDTADQYSVVYFRRFRNQFPVTNVNTLTIPSVSNHIGASIRYTIKFKWERGDEGIVIGFEGKKLDFQSRK